jgi:pyrroloquinoline quinone biosynthesis protein E
VDVTAQPPLGMLAELTHRCPLHCPYCSNPIELVTRSNELSTEDWLSVLSQARELGVLQVHMSGGEPLVRPDLPSLVEHASSLGCYVNLVTSGLGLTEERLTDLADRGLAHVQLSVQGADAEIANKIAGVKAHLPKLAAARVVKKLGLPLTVNVVLHRANHHQVGALIDLAENMGADRLELANTQYYGWGLRNRDALMPTSTQLAEAEPIVTVAPNGDVLPCPAASAITTLRLDNVRSRSLADIWYHSESFNAYRGTGWMPDPCRSCERKGVDFGGCRCQAFLLTGSASATDPVCTKSPDRPLIDKILAGTPAEVPPFVMRTNTVKVVR